MIQGKYWYQDTHQLCKHWSQETGYSMVQVVGILAVLSPMINWSTNKKWTYQVLTRDNPPNYMFQANLDKALRIKYGENPSEVIGPKSLKVRSFFANILRPHGSSITIDRHMLRIIGWHKETVTPKQYRELGSMFQTQARYHKLKPCEYQAILWCHTRGKVD